MLEPVERISEFLFGLTAARFEWKTSWRLVLVIDSERVAGSIFEDKGNIKTAQLKFWMQATV